MAEQDVRSPEKERQILAGAAAAFARDGYEGASMSHIAARAGVSKGTLYNYFAGKKELFTAFVQRECTEKLHLMFDEMDVHAPVQDTLLRIGRRMVDMLLSDSGLLIYRMVVAEAQKFPELAEAFFEAGPRRAMDRMTPLIDEQVRAGHLCVEDAAFATEQLFALMQTRLILKRRMNLISHITEADKERVVHEAVKLFMRGYGPQVGPG